MVENVICRLCLIAWLTAGATIENIFDDWHAAIIFVVAIIVTVVCAAVITWNDK